MNNEVQSRCLHVVLILEVLHITVPEAAFRSSRTTLASEKVWRWNTRRLSRPFSSRRSDVTASGCHVPSMPWRHCTGRKTDDVINLMCHEMGFCERFWTEIVNYKKCVLLLFVNLIDAEFTWNLSVSGEQIRFLKLINVSQLVAASACHSFVASPPVISEQTSGWNSRMKLSENWLTFRFLQRIK